jgi:hypothetical protein
MTAVAFCVFLLRGCEQAYGVHGAIALISQHATDLRLEKKSLSQGHRQLCSLHGAYPHIAMISEVHLKQYVLSIAIPSL